MSTTKKSARRTRDTIVRRYGRGFYQKIGQQGGEESKDGGFASRKRGKDGLRGKQRAKVAGAKGGRANRGKTLRRRRK
jgi:hypothetical protein